MNFEKATFAAWRDAAPAAAMAALKQPILARDAGGAVGVNFAPALRELMLEARYLDRMHFDIPPVALQARRPRLGVGLGDGCARGARMLGAARQRGRWGKQELMERARVPRTPRLQVALQEDEYRRWIEALEGLLEKYYKARAMQPSQPPALDAGHAACGLTDAGLHTHTCNCQAPMRKRTRKLTPSPPTTQATSALSPAEADLLSARLAALAKALEPGLGRLNWNSRGVDDFVSKAGAAVHDFNGLVNQARFGA